MASMANTDRLRAARDRFGWRAFDVAFRPWMQRRLHVRMAGLPSDLPGDVPLLLVANHVSWWDGFLLRAVQRALRPASTLYTVALEREVVKHPILRMIGAIPIVPSSPSSLLRAVRSIERKRAAMPDAVFGYFPQGRITPSYRRPLEFRRGLDVFARALAPVIALPVAIHIEPMTAAAPTAFVSLGEPLRATQAYRGHTFLEREVERNLDRLLAFLATHGEDALAAWPAPEATITPVARRFDPPALLGPTESLA